MAESSEGAARPLAERLEGLWRGLIGWLDARFPLVETWEYHLSKYYAPKNHNFWYLMGWLATLILVNQLVTGIWLTMFYVPSGEGAFASIEHIMRDVAYGDVLRYMHSTGASAFFLIVYLHMFRGLMYGSYRKPRELVWLIGMAIYLALMAEGFFGYLLPWGNMSYWGAQVIVSLFGSVPVVGPDLAEWIRGDFVMSEITLNRFFALHVVAVPLILVGLVFVHFVALHHVGSSAPDGVDIKRLKDASGKPLDGVAFWPYTVVHDVHATVVFLFLFCAVVFFAPEMGGYFLEKPNFEVANPMKTPEHIAPVWYYTPFYAMLRAVTFPLFGIEAKFWGFVVMSSAIVLLFFLPWLDKSPVASMRNKGMASRWMLALFVVSFLILGYLGVTPASNLATAAAQIFTLIYFAYFVLMPWYTRAEKTTEPPERVTMR